MILQKELISNAGQIETGKTETGQIESIRHYGRPGAQQTFSKITVVCKYQGGQYLVH